MLVVLFNYVFYLQINEADIPAVLTKGFYNCVLQDQSGLLRGGKPAHGHEEDPTEDEDGGVRGDRAAHR